MKDLKKLFYNPPKGGNGEGVRTQSSMAGAVPMAPSAIDMSPGRIGKSPPAFPGPGATNAGLSDDFASGVVAARVGALHASAVGQTEFRNYHAGARAPQEVQEAGPVNVYDYERRADSEPEAPPGFKRVTPELHPDTSMPYRTDGKPLR